MGHNQWSPIDSCQTNNELHRWPEGNSQSAPISNKVPAAANALLNCASDCAESFMVGSSCLMYSLRFSINCAADENDKNITTSV